MKRTLLFLVGVIISMSTYSYTPSPSNFHKYSVVHPRTALPNKYDSRDLGIILPARNQMNTNTCWAFTGCDVSQALFHKKDSESGFLAPLVYVNCANSLGFTDVNLNSGGNEDIVVAMHSMLMGPVYQSSVPQLTETSSSKCTEYTQDDIHNYILDTSTLPEDDHIAIKQAIIEYGSVYASIYMREIYLTNDFEYEYTGEEEADHAVSIIGWDDSKSAWLVKNTWGDWGPYNGCFWVSYNDVHISKRCSSFNKFVSKEEINKVYSYSKTGHNGNFGFDIKNYPTTIIVAYEIEKGDTIEYISTYITQPNTKVKMIIQSGEKGNKLLYEGEEETIKYKGMHLHKLTKPVVSDGTSILAEICYISDSIHAAPIETSTKFKKIIPHDKQWLYIPGTEDKDPTWYEVGKNNTDGYNYNFVVYIYTKKGNINTKVEENISENNNTVLSGGKINPTIWNKAKQINVFDISGRNFCTIKNGGNLPPLNKGYYVLVIDNIDGSFTTERFNIY